MAARSRMEQAKRILASLLQQERSAPLAELDLIRAYWPETVGPGAGGEVPSGHLGSAETLGRGPGAILDDTICADEGSDPALPAAGIAEDLRERDRVRRPESERPERSPRKQGRT